MSSGTPENFVENLVETQFTYRKFCTSNRMVLSAINDKFGEW